jgi:hypothetical protein
MPWETVNYHTIDAEIKRDSLIGINRSKMIIQLRPDLKRCAMNQRFLKTLGFSETELEFMKSWESVSQIISVKIGSFVLKVEFDIVLNDIDKNKICAYLGREWLELNTDMDCGIVDTNLKMKFLVWASRTPHGNNSNEIDIDRELYFSELAQEEDEFQEQVT